MNLDVKSARRPSAIATSSTMVAVLVGTALLGGCDGIDQCEPGGCAACVAETCTQQCVDPDDEDVGYSCSLSCSEGADCDVSCDGGVSCSVECEASTCYSDRVDAHCTSGARCEVDTSSSNAFCDESSCDVRCGAHGGVGGWCNVACVKGSDCSVSCGAGDGKYEGSRATECALSCDESSSCELQCEARCILCCNGSPDCAMECASGEGTNCVDGAIACGGPCPGPESPCPALVYQPTF